MPQPIPQTLNVAAQATLEAWHVMLESNNMDALESLFTEDVVFRSPVAHTAYPGRTATTLVLRTVNTVFEDFQYHRSFATDDGLSVVLEFSANVSGKALKGIDMIRFNADGKIVEFEVMVRPATGLQALGAAMGAKLADKLGLLKAGA
ncbi:nuclear transport factor 2 family protein [Ralstonia mannitolilytica]|uniref:SnoaL-like domain-containing protein n=1 Tax=Ralstonia mannitolilytica TaxID=105219 RepID=A0AAD2B0M0_9RALS|nr:nuclear transport factor 2 family protein [Ralstonia mannitolilytica]ATG22213.1 nuclear transport factor 2 family protein [Ralstonia pickettii]ANA35030.1 membrane protein [Ralstonia mannitolilytica]MBY4717137.1 nuclear transport factor 2 family protein [Ralstonia mannitolilytica]CAJ0684718.1 hypothetical protein LMG18102_00258 [Ralstonia mannitolilytica]CAJ0689278.1 hypothetical protein R82526_03291 [Ralstonia mannitolilytica]